MIMFYSFLAKCVHFNLPPFFRNDHQLMYVYVCFYHFVLVVIQGAALGMVENHGMDERENSPEDSSLCSLMISLPPSFHHFLLFFLFQRNIINFSII